LKHPEWRVKKQSLRRDAGYDAKKLYEHEDEDDDLYFEYEINFITESEDEEDYKCNLYKNRSYNSQDNEDEVGKQLCTKKETKRVQNSGSDCQIA
jgi:hypothetical protein